MANLNRNFREYFHNVADPYPTVESFYNPFRADPAVQPATIVNSLESNTYPLALLMAGSDHNPVLVVAPFSPPALPGAAVAANKYACAGDISPNGALPALVQISNACFHLTDNVDVLVQGDMGAAWAALPVGALTLDPPAAGANVDNIRTRMVMPLTHRFVGPAYDAIQQNIFTWQWISTNICDVVMADPVLAVEGIELVNFVRVASTRRSAVGGGAVRDPQVEMNITGALTTAAIQDKAMTHARDFLPGLREPIGVGAQLQLQNTQLQAMGQAILQANTTPPVTLGTKYGPLLDQVLRLCEVSTEAELAPFWGLMANVKSGHRFATAESLMARIASASTPSMMAPIISPALMVDIVNGMFTGDLNRVTKGFSIARFLPGNSPNKDDLNSRNVSYMTVSSGAGTAGLPAVNVMLMDKEVAPPTSSEQFRGYIEGYSVACAAFLGNHSRIVRAYNDQVVNRRNEIISSIEGFYEYEEDRRAAWATILMFLYRIFNNWFIQTLAGEVPLVTGTPGQGAPDAAPDFSVILESVVSGKVLQLTTLSPDFYQRPPPAQGAPPPLTRPHPGTRTGTNGAGTGTGTTGDTAAGANANNRRAVRLPDQNPNLKAAWQATGIRSIYGSASPFHDPSAANGRRVIPSDTPNMRICLPCCLTGVCYDNCTGFHGTLSDAEVQRVATAGNLVVE